jgi:tryptophan-rich sensory protein
MAANPSWIIPVAVGAAAAMVVAGAGTTMTELGPWYQGLQQPTWAPPDWAFGVIWTIIFSLTTIAGVSAWRRSPDSRTSEALIGMFAFNGFLNLLWSFLFFKMQRPDWALIEVALLWLSILALIVMTARYARTAALLLVPYLVWVTIAAALNYDIVVLNSPFT